MANEIESVRDYCGDARFCDCRRGAEAEAARKEAEARVLRCMSCGLPYSEFPLDVVLPDEQWAAISGRPHGDCGGVLCAACIVARGSELPGVTVAKLRFE